MLPDRLHLLGRSVKLRWGQTRPIRGKLSITGCSMNPENPMKKDLALQPKDIQITLTHLIKQSPLNQLKGLP